MATATRKKPKARTGVQGRRCGATKGNGDPCTLTAGHGTDHVGSGRCKFHGGRSPMGNGAAAKEQANELAQPVEVDPGQAIQAAMWSAAGEVAWAHGKVAEMTEDELVSEESGEHFMLRFKHRAEERMVKFAKAGADMGIEIAKLQLAQTQTALIGKLIEAVVERLDLTDEQRQQVGPAIRESMAILDTTATEVK